MSTRLGSRTAEGEAIGHNFASAMNGYDNTEIELLTEKREIGKIAQTVDDIVITLSLLL